MDPRLPTEPSHCIGARRMLSEEGVRYSEPSYMHDSLHRIHFSDMFKNRCQIFVLLMLKLLICKNVKMLHCFIFEHVFFVIYFILHVIFNSSKAWLHFIFLLLKIFIQYTMKSLYFFLFLMIILHNFLRLKSLKQNS